MNIKEFMNIVMASMPNIEKEVGRELSVDEKRSIIKGAIDKWNGENPDNWLVIPAEFLKQEYMDIILLILFFIFFASLFIIPFMVFGVLLSAIYVSFKARGSMKQ